jgi:hypothetical protein
MAKRIVKWSLDGSILKMSRPIEDPKAVAEVFAEFDLTKLYPTFKEMTVVQSQIIVYGVKQKLMDCGASEVGAVDGKVTAARKKWDELLAGRWEGERVNSTGASENKRVIAEVKKASEAVTLQGLLIKQTLYPEKFTPEDQMKLEEFLAVMVKAEMSAKKTKK